MVGSPISPPRFAGALLIVDVSRHRIVKIVRLPGIAKPMGVAIGRSGDRVYESNGHGNSVAVLDRRGYVLKTIRVGKRSWDLALSSDD